jgi:hypothetical protein
VTCLEFAVLADSPTHFFARFLTFDHRFFAAFAIAALPAADKTRFLTPLTSGSAECPKALQPPGRRSTTRCQGGLKSKCEMLLAGPRNRASGVLCGQDLAQGPES